MNIKALALASAMMAFSGAANADFVIDLAGQEADGAALSNFSVINADTDQVVDVNFDFIYDAGNNGDNISWGSELVIELYHVPTDAFFQIGTQDEGCDAFGLTCDFDLMWDDAPGVYTASGTVEFNDAIADGSGEYVITIGDSFDDAGIDGVFLTGSNFTVNQEAAAVPVPATLLLVGIGLLGMGASRRRA